MKVLGISFGKVMGNCDILTKEALFGAKEAFPDAEVKFINTVKMKIGRCIGCGACKKCGECVFGDDLVNLFVKKAREADGFVFGTPVYYAHPSGRLLSVLDRLFYAGGDAFAHKAGAVVASARRAGTTASLDAVTKHLTIAQMPVVSSTYWNMVHGNAPEEVKQDLEGMQTMRNLGRNMAWLLKCIEAGKSAGIALPDTEKKVRTNFIR